jgi:hypothetical protein
MSRHTLTVAALAILSFGLTLAALWMQRAPNVPVALPGRAALSRVWAALSARPSAPAAATAAAVAAPPARALPPDADVPAYDMSGPPLPVMFAVSSVRGPVAEDDADDASVPSNRIGVTRQVDLVNESDAPLEITVLATYVPTQETTQAQLFVPPHGQAHAGRESGLKLEPGYQIALHGRGYQELVETVR